MVVQIKETIFTCLISKMVGFWTIYISWFIFIYFPGIYCKWWKTLLIYRRRRLQGHFRLRLQLYKWCPTSLGSKYQGNFHNFFIIDLKIKHTYLDSGINVAPGISISVALCLLRSLEYVSAFKYLNLTKLHILQNNTLWHWICRRLKKNDMIW